MKTRYWVAIIVAIGLVGLVALRFTGGGATWIEVRCDGQVIQRFSLAVDQEYTITTAYGTNVLSIRAGEVTVTEADCPGGDCTRMTLTAGGSPIVCLPHHLVISCAENGDIDGISG